MDPIIGIALLLGTSLSLNCVLFIWLYLSRKETEDCRKELLDSPLDLGKARDINGTPYDPNAHTNPGNDIPSFLKNQAGMATPGMMSVWAWVALLLVVLLLGPAL